MLLLAVATTAFILLVDTFMTLPKFGYKHTMGRPGSIIQTCKETMAPDEIKWWVAQAKKEYYYNYDRAITYQQ